MQALNVQIVNPQEHEIARKSVSPQKKEGKAQEASFSEMVQSASREAGRKAARAKEPGTESVSQQELPEASVASCPAESAYSPASQAALAQYVPVPQIGAVMQASASSAAESEPEIPQLKRKETLQMPVPLEADAVQLALLNEAVPEAAVPVSAEALVQAGLEAEALPVSLNDADKDDGQLFSGSRSLPEQLSGTEAELQTVPAALAGVPVQPAEQKEQKERYFSLELAGDGTQPAKDAPSLFESLFTVTDERSVEQKIADFKAEMNIGSEKSDSSMTLAMTLSEAARQNILSSDSQSAGASGSTFQQMLAQQVQENAPDFARAGSIVLRDNDSGSINMILKPESLGNVKINLQLSDNGITGQITVNSREAFEAFRQNLDTLRQAFQDSGFENASLNLSFADTSSGPFSNGERQDSSGQFLSGQVYGKYAADRQDSASAAEAALYEGISDRKVSVII